MIEKIGKDFKSESGLLKCKAAVLHHGMCSL